MTPPKISVLLPVHNAEDYLENCLDSLIGQTFSDFEIIAIDDKSTDNSLQILKDYAQRDRRIRVFHNETNLKLAKTLNKGICLAQAPLIARMDADDIALPKRFEIQYEFMKNNPDIDICGTWAQGFCETNRRYSVPVDHNTIFSALPFFNPMLHPTVIMRTDILQNNLYNEAFDRTQDYELWARMLLTGVSKFHNIPKVLLLYRYKKKNISNQFYLKTKEYILSKIFMKNISSNDILINESVSTQYKENISFNIYDQRKWLNDLIIANKKSKKIPQQNLVKIATSILINILAKEKKLHIYFILHTTFIQNKLISILIYIIKKYFYK